MVSLLQSLGKWSEIGAIELKTTMDTQRGKDTFGVC